MPISALRDARGSCESLDATGLTYAGLPFLVHMPFTRRHSSACMATAARGSLDSDGGALRSGQFGVAPVIAELSLSAATIARRSASRARLVWTSAFLALLALPLTLLVPARWEYGGGEEPATEIAPGTTEVDVVRVEED